MYRDERIGIRGAVFRGRPESVREEAVVPESCAHGLQPGSTAAASPAARARKAPPVSIRKSGRYKKYE
jgi:hypothetical protein